MTTMLAEARAQAHAEIAKSTAHAQGLISVAGTMLTIGATALSLATLPAPVRDAGWAAVGTWAMAMGSVLLALRPNLRGDHGIVRWARLDASILNADLRAPDHFDRDAAAVIWLSRAAVRKHRRVRLAVDLLLASPLIAVMQGLLSWLI